jgi:hypothetical protein
LLLLSHRPLPLSVPLPHLSFRRHPEARSWPKDLSSVLSLPSPLHWPLPLSAQLLLLLLLLLPSL